MGLLYQKRRLKVNKIKRQINANRVNLQKIRMLLSFILISGICYFCYWFLKLPAWYIPTSKLESADKSVFIIQGNNLTPTYKIYDVIRQTQLPYKQIFRLKTNELEQNLSQLQSVKKAYIRRYWFPARLIISLEERTPAFVLVPNLEAEPNSALTTDGVLIDHDYFPLKSTIKTKKLLTYGVRDGVDEVWDKEKVDSLLKLVRAIETYSGQEVQYIDIRNQKDVYIMIKEYLIRFGEISDSSLNRAKWIASILPEARKINQKIKYIDLRWEDSYYLRLEGAKEINKDLSANKPKAQTQTQIQTQTQKPKEEQAQTKQTNQEEQNPEEVD